VLIHNQDACSARAGVILLIAWIEEGHTLETAFASGGGFGVEVRTVIDRRIDHFVEQA
jgi:hypothetical protein